MNKEWLFLRFFDEANDPPVAQMPVVAYVLWVILHAVMPVGMALACVAYVRADARTALMWAAAAIASSLVLTALCQANHRPGHARNQLVLTALMAVAAVLAAVLANS